MVRTMKKLSCDIETFSDVDLIRCGVYKYADSPNFEMLLFAYAVDDGDVHIIDIAGGEELPEEIIQAIKSETCLVKTAYNATIFRNVRVCQRGVPSSLPEGEISTGSLGTVQRCRLRNWHCLCRLPMSEVYSD